MKLNSYQSYRQFLKDFFHSKKKENPKYSLIFFSKLIGSSDSYIKLVLSGKRNLNLDKAKLLCDKLKFSQLETSYFITLVLQESAKTDDLKDYYEHILANFKELLDIQYTESTSLTSILRDPIARDIYALVSLPNFQADATWISQILTNSDATKERVQSTLQYLLDMGAITKSEESYRAEDIVFKHQDSTDAYIIGLRRSIDYLRQKEQRENTEHFDSFTMILSEKEYMQVKELLDETKRKMIDLLSHSKNKDDRTRIAYYNTNLFYASKK